MHRFVFLNMSLVTCLIAFVHAAHSPRKNNESHTAVDGDVDPETIEFGSPKEFCIDFIVEILQQKGLVEPQCDNDEYFGGFYNGSEEKE